MKYNNDDEYIYHFKTNLFKDVNCKIVTIKKGEIKSKPITDEFLEHGKQIKSNWIDEITLSNLSSSNNNNNVQNNNFMMMDINISSSDNEDIINYQLENKKHETIIKKIVNKNKNSKEYSDTLSSSSSSSDIDSLSADENHVTNTINKLEHTTIKISNKNNDELEYKQITALDVTSSSTSDSEESNNEMENDSEESNNEMENDLNNQLASHVQQQSILNDLQQRNSSTSSSLLILYY